jgi:tetratricopeptide (TPR) repeat protein
MKAEERKHLETNTLVEGIGKLSHSLRGGVPRSVWIGLAVIVLAYGLYWTWNFYATRSLAANSELWWKWDQVGNGDTLAAGYAKLPSIDKESSTFVEKLEGQQLEAFINDNKGTLQARLAQFELARLNLFEGLRDLGTSLKPQREAALKRLQDAAFQYKQLIQESRSEPILHQEALLNSGKANEALGDIKQATEYYTKLATDYKTSRFGKLAEKELKRLETNAKVIAELSKQLTEVPSN